MGTERKEVSIPAPIMEQVGKWKKQHGKLFLVETKDADGQKLEFVFRKPDMATMGAVTKFAESNPLESTLMLFKNCLLNDENLHYADDVDVMMSISPHLEKLIEQRESSIKEL